MDKIEHGEDMLKALFAEARRDARAAASPELLARVLADAEDLQPVTKAPVSSEQPGILHALFGALGGWRPVAGLATAAAAGVWIGVAGSASLVQGDLASSLLGSGQQGFLSEFDESYAYLADLGE